MKKLRKEVARERDFAFLLYLDSANPKWKQVLSDLKIPIFWILHDKDTVVDDETGEVVPKKPHYHIMLMFENPRSENTARKISVRCGGNGHLEELISRRGYARYLIHSDNPEKYQYSANDVTCLGGADYNFSSATIADIKRTGDNILIDIINYCKMVNIIAYCQLIDYCIESRREWLSFLRSPNGRIVRDYIKSHYWYKSL